MALKPFVEEEGGGLSDLDSTLKGIDVPRGWGEGSERFQVGY